MNTPIAAGLKTTLLVHLVVGLVFGLGYLLVPMMVGSFFGFDAADPAWRVLGAAILGYAMSSWWGFRAEYWEQVQIVVEMEVVWTVLGALATMWAIFSGALPAIGWLNVAVLLVFAVAFGYFWAKENRVSTQTVGMQT